jgi:large subunit ribosomal protein L7/L12
MDDAQLAHRFSILEAQVKLLSEHLGVPCPAMAGAADGGRDTALPDANGGASDEVAELARAGKMTQAISLHRRLTGASLLEAKQFVENL